MLLKVLRLTSHMSAGQGAKIEMMILAFFYIIFYIGDGTVAVVVVVVLHFVIN